MKKIFLSLFIISIFYSCKVNKTVALKNTGTIGNKVMVSTAHPLASEVGLQILKEGGNAVDAAVAIQFALAVVYPAAGNIGGGGFMVYRSANGEVNTLDFREKAPEAAFKDMYLDENGDAVSDRSRYGQLAAGVPGSVDGMFTAHEKYGSMAMSKLIQPAIDLAKNGFKLLPKEAEKLNENKADFLNHNPENSYLIKESGWKTGDIVKIPDLARTLFLIQKNGRNGFYKGLTAKFITTEMQRANGIITEKDLANYKSIWRKAIEIDYKEYKLYSMGPPSSGGIAIAQILGMISNQDLSSYKHNSVEYIHLIAEAERRAYADRATHLGDMDYWNVPIGQLLEKKYLKKRMASFNSSKATTSDAIQAGNFAMNESEETTHFSVVDKAGNAVSITTTLNGSFGSKVFVTGAGFLLNNEMDDFSAKPGVPNLYGLVGAEANAIEPGKRMLSSMTPTIVTQNGKLKMVLGTPGGSTIITSVLQSFLNVAEFDMTMKEAIDVPKFHHQWLPDSLYIEPTTLTLDKETKLKNIGHSIAEKKSIGRMDCILINDNSQLEGYSDSRAEGKALGY